MGLTLVWVALAACQRPVPESSGSFQQLPPGFAARVGSQWIGTDSVMRIAQVQKLSPRLARERAIQDALFAEGARARADLSGAVRSIERAGAARGLLEQLAREALDQGPPQNQEIFSLVKENWRLLDRPASARTTHVVVLVEDASRARQARLLAERLRARVLDASAPDDFIQRALAVPAEGFQVRAERLPPVAADGRVTEQDPKRTSSEPFDQSFAQAANSLEHPGDISPVTHSKFGFHVILLEERLPARKVETEELRRQLAPEVYSRRAALARQRLLGQLSRRTPVEMQRSALALTEQIGSTP